MRLKKITIEGFRTFKTKQVFDLSKFKDNSFIYVTGINKTEESLGGNDCGKTSIFESIIWGVFGKTSVNLKANNVINWNCKSCKVTIETENFVLTRQQNPNIISIDGEVKTQEDIDKLIGLDYYGFLYSVFISQFSDKFFDLDPSDKLRVFSNIFQFNDWLERSDRAKNKAKKIESQIYSEEINLSNCKGKISTLRSQDYKNKIQEWQSQNKRAIENREIRIKNYKDEIQSLRNNINNFNAEEEKINEALSVSEKELKNQSIILTDLKENYNSKKEIFISKSTNEDNKEREIQKFERVKSICSSCFQSVSKTYKAKILTDLKNELIILTKEVLRIKKESENIYSKIQDKKKVKDFLIEEVLNYKSKLSEINSKINGYKFNINKISSFIKELNNDLSKFKNEKNPYEKLEETRINNLKELKEKNIQLSSKIEELESKKKQFEYWIKGFKEIRLMVLSDALNEFEICINNNLSKLGLDDWEVELDVERETKGGKSIKKGFEVTIKSPYNNNYVPFKVWGGGVSQRLRIAGTIGLMDLIDSKTNKNWDIEIWDEPTQFLSSNGIENLLEILTDRANKNNKKIFFIDHRKLSSYGGFTDIITIIKDSNGSRIGEN